MSLDEETSFVFWICCVLKMLDLRLWLVMKGTFSGRPMMTWSWVVGYIFSVDMVLHTSCVRWSCTVPPRSPSDPDFRGENFFLPVFFPSTPKKGLRHKKKKKMDWRSDERLTSDVRRKVHPTWRPDVSLDNKVPNRSFGFYYLEHWRQFYSFLNSGNWLVTSVPLYGRVRWKSE